MGVSHLPGQVGMEEGSSTSSTPTETTPADARTKSASMGSSPSPADIQTKQQLGKEKDKPTKSTKKSAEKKPPSSSGSVETFFSKASIKKCMKFNSEVHNVSGMHTYAH